MCPETAFLLLTVVCGLKKTRHRLAEYLQSRLAFISAMFNVLLDLFHSLHPHAHAMPHQMSIAEFTL
ncbi:MAG: hypothetical protein RMK99_00220 [Anaerolineales bacterium]|nr:hypothetical protein [Anaerolineales bacterium]